MDDVESLHLVGHSVAVEPASSSSNSSSDSSSDSSSSSTSTPFEPKRKARKTQKQAQDEQRKTQLDQLQVHRPEAFRWAKRMFGVCGAGRKCKFDRIDMFSEFSGTTCAESAMESVVNHISTDERPEFFFTYTADIKPACRQTAMATRHQLSHLLPEYHQTKPFESLLFPPPPRSICALLW